MKPILLIADGDAGSRELYQGYLSEHGYLVETASNGVDCLGKLRRVRPAVLVLDLGLRWGGGDGVIALLRENGLESEVAVVLTAAGDSFRDAVPAVEPPVVQFLPKPFALTILLNAVRAVVAQKEREKWIHRNRAAACSEQFFG
jgi:DNA-binding NtrC family response regulator